SLAITQILKQLLLNSIVHAFEDNRPGNIHIDVSIDESSVLIHYYDDGVGLSAEHLKTLFDPFFTTKRNAGGTGLGTHVVYNLVTQALGGSIQASSESGEGLAFDIRFPLNNCPT
ncbi:MAG: ATP-binding protein, partial [Pseudomonadales bacterium]|nr:ATP-binding protein [Pseudomonadales bacterium]